MYEVIFIFILCSLFNNIQSSLLDVKIVIRWFYISVFFIYPSWCNFYWHVTWKCNMMHIFTTFLCCGHWLIDYNLSSYDSTSFHLTVISTSINSSKSNSWKYLSKHNFLQKKTHKQHKKNMYSFLWKLNYVNLGKNNEIFNQILISVFERKLSLRKFK